MAICIGVIYILAAFKDRSNIGNPAVKSPEEQLTVEFATGLINEDTEVIELIASFEKQQRLLNWFDIKRDAIDPCVWGIKGYSYSFSKRDNTHSIWIECDTSYLRENYQVILINNLIIEENEPTGALLIADWHSILLD